MLCGMGVSTRAYHISRCSIIVEEETLIALSATNRKQLSVFLKIARVPQRTLSGTSRVTRYFTSKKTLRTLSAVNSTLSRTIRTSVSLFRGLRHVRMTTLAAMVKITGINGRRTGKFPIQAARTVTRAISALDTFALDSKRIARCSGCS